MMFLSHFLEESYGSLVVKRGMRGQKKPSACSPEEKKATSSNMSVRNTLERDDVMQSTHMFCMWRFFYLNPTKATNERLPPKANGNGKSGNGTEHSTEAFPIGHTGELAETQPKAMWFIHNGEG